MRQSTLVIQTSPIGSARSVLAGNRGARLCEPQMRCKKTGSMRLGAGFTSLLLDRGFHAGEEFFKAPQAFVDALDGGGVGKPQIPRRAERFAGHDRNLRTVEELARKLGAIFRQRVAVRTVLKKRRNIREGVERAAGPLAGDAGNII